MLIESTQFLLNDLQSVQSDLENLIQFGFDKPIKQNVIFLSIFFFRDNAAIMSTDKGNTCTIVNYVSLLSVQILFFLSYFTLSIENELRIFVDFA